MQNRIVIPTPVKCDFTGRKLEFSKFKIENGSLVAPYALEMGHTLLDGKGKGAKLICGKLKHKKSQAYEITIFPNKVRILGASDIAFIYAMSTLLQLADIGKEKIILPESKIFDYPEFEVRATNWQLFVEVRGWSQDAGNGQEAFLARFISGLDTLAFFKLNAVYADGFGWHPERFPGYGELMRKLNREARRRGIKLIFGGYNAGYGAQWFDFDGPKFQNRKSYPDGEIYSCIDPQRHSEIGNKMGTCLSNKVLLEEKKKNLIEFIKAVEPGCVSLHGVDIDRQEQAKKAWASRCLECRKRWPDDVTTAESGMAGAFASFYDELYDAIVSVKNPESGYDAARDCLIRMASPNYTNFSEDDSEWQYHLEYFKVLTKSLRNKNIYLAVREQFFNYAEGKPRFMKLREVIGNEYKFFVGYFSSGEAFFNSLPVTADAALIRYFCDMDAVFAGSGNAFQEPRQIITAEYMWNPKGSAFEIGLPEYSSNNTFLPYYYDLSSARIQPEAVFGKNGLLEIVCKKLYGAGAGKLIAQVCRPDLVPISDPKRNSNKNSSKTPVAPMFPLTNEMLPGFHFSAFYKGKDKVIWSNKLNENIIKKATLYERIMPYIVRLTEVAEQNYRKAADVCSSELPINPEMRKSHLLRMADTCITGIGLAKITQRWLKIFILAYHRAKEGKDDEELQALIKDCSDDLMAFAKPLHQLAEKTIDPNKGDLGQVIYSIKFIFTDLKNISHTLKTGKYLEAELDSWW